MSKESFEERVKNAKVITQEDIDKMDPEERREWHLMTCKHEPNKHGVCGKDDCFCSKHEPEGVAHCLFDAGVIDWHAQDCVAHELFLAYQRGRKDAEEKYKSPHSL